MALLTTMMRSVPRRPLSFTRFTVVFSFKSKTPLQTSSQSLDCNPLSVEQWNRCIAVYSQTSIPVSRRRESAGGMSNFMRNLQVVSSHQLWQHTL